MEERCSTQMLLIDGVRFVLEVMRFRLEIGFSLVVEICLRATVHTKRMTDVQICARQYMSRLSYLGERFTNHVLLKISYFLF